LKAKHCRSTENCCLHFVRPAIRVFRSARHGCPKRHATYRRLAAPSCSGILLLAVVGYLLLTRRRAAAWLMLGAVSSGVALNSLLKFSFARPRPDLVVPAVRVFTASSQAATPPLSANHLFDIGSPVGPNPFRDPGADLFHDARRDAHGPGRPEPNLSRSSLSDRCAGGLCIGTALGHGLLGAHDMAATRGTSRAAGKVMTLLRESDRCPPMQGSGLLRC